MVEILRGKDVHSLRWGGVWVRGEGNITEVLRCAVTVGTFH